MTKDILGDSTKKTSEGDMGSDIRDLGGGVVVCEVCKPIKCLQIPAVPTRRTTVVGSHVYSVSEGLVSCGYSARNPLTVQQVEELLSRPGGKESISLTGKDTGILPQIPPVIKNIRK